MGSVENQGEFLETKEDNQEILSIDQIKENNLIEFIIETRQQGFNCLDLSNKTIQDFPSEILEFPLLQYLYFEGNKLTQLPSDLFLRLPNLKWLDLRNNQLISLPNSGLAKHISLQYLLLSRNRLRTLPFELGKVKTLSALNLDGNPLTYPPFDIIKQGIRAIQQYLREKLPNDDDDDDDDSSVSSDEDPREETPRFPSRPINPRKFTSETSYYETTTPSSSSNPLPSHLQSCIQYKQMSYSAIRPSSSFRSRAQSEMRFSHVKSKTEIIKPNNNNTEKDVFITRESSLMHMKHRNIKIDDEIEHLRQQSFLINYEEPIIHTPFLMDPHYTPMVHKDSQTPSINNRRRNHSIEDDEEKRKHDRQIQDRIRQITDRMLRRRLEARASLFEEKRQVRLELREIRRLESDAIKVHRLKSQKKS